MTTPIADFVKAYADSGVYEYGCELFKKRIECAVMMKVAESEE